MEKIIFEIILAILPYVAKQVYKLAINNPYLFYKYMTKGLDFFTWFLGAFAFLLMTYVFTLAYIDGHTGKIVLLLIPAFTLLLTGICARKAQFIYNKA